MPHVKKKYKKFVTLLSSTNSTSSGVFFKLRSANSWIWCCHKIKIQWGWEHWWSRSSYILNISIGQSKCTLTIWEIKPITRCGYPTTNKIRLLQQFSYQQWNTIQLYSKRNAISHWIFITILCQLSWMLVICSLFETLCECRTKVNHILQHMQLSKVVK